MEVKQLALKALFFISSFHICIGLTIKDSLTARSFRQRNERICVELGKHPYFDIDQIAGKTWRVYYAWNVNLDAKCLDMTFRNATPTIINRFFNDMSEYTETQPNWDAATMFVTMSSSNHELLLFANQGSAGSFDGVPNVIKGGNLKPIRRGVPLLKFFIKLVQDGQFLLMIDCHIGVASLSARFKPGVKEVEDLAKQFKIGDGSLACLRS